MLRLQDMEIQYRREKEEADLLLEQHRLVRAAQRQVAPGQVLMRPAVFAVRRQRQRRRLGQALL